MRGSETPAAPEGSTPTRATRNALAATTGAPAAPPIAGRPWLTEAILPEYCTRRARLQATLNQETDQILTPSLGGGVIEQPPLRHLSPLSNGRRCPGSMPSRGLRRVPVDSDPTSVARDRPALQTNIHRIKIGQIAGLCFQGEKHPRLMLPLLPLSEHTCTMTASLAVPVAARVCRFYVAILLANGVRCIACRTDIYDGLLHCCYAFSQSSLTLQISLLIHIYFYIYQMWSKNNENARCEIERHNMKYKCNHSPMQKANATMHE